jgi:hypothetical protein
LVSRLARDIRWIAKPPPSPGNSPRQSFDTELCDQLDAEKGSIVIASNTDDAQEEISAFIAKRRPNFRAS